jgi:hypothetical protein
MFNQNGVLNKEIILSNMFPLFFFSWSFQILIVDAPWYVSNATLHADLGISHVQDVIHQNCNNHYTRLETHENSLLKNFY